MLVRRCLCSFAVQNRELTIDALSSTKLRTIRQRLSSDLSFPPEYLMIHRLDKSQQGLPLLCLLMVLACSLLAICSVRVVLALPIIILLLLFISPPADPQGMTASLSS